MKYGVTLIKKTLYNFTVEAGCEEDAVMEAYAEYERALDDGTLPDYYEDSDILVEDIGSAEEDNSDY